MIKEAFLEAAESLFDDFKNKLEIISDITDVQLSRNTVMRLCKVMGEDLTTNSTQLTIYKLVSITTDGAPVMTGCINGFIALCKSDDDFPEFVWSQLEESEAEHTDLLLHTDVRWLSRGKFLQRFGDLLFEIKEFLPSKDAEYKQFEDKVWLLDLAFLTNVTVRLNELNLALQGKDKNIVQMISSVTAFKQKLKLLSSQLQRHKLRNFKNMMSELKSQGKAPAHDSGRYIEQVYKIITEFDRRFQDFAVLEPVATFLCFSFGVEVDVDEIATKIASLFHMETSAVESEILTLQSDLQIEGIGGRLLEPYRGGKISKYEKN
ncbi:GT2D2 protein, partial [Polyodon spathula]|nr:GT2D2 protein [Polyodon spathula]